MNIKKLSVILLLICLCLKQLPTLSCPYVYKKPKSYDRARENIAKSDDFYDYDNRYTEVLPNPVVYLYGKNTNSDPILLMVFSSTIPVEWLNGEKSSNLDSIVLKLKIPEQHGYFYKILKMSANQILQTVAYSTSSTIHSSVEGQGDFPAGGGGSGSITGKIEHTFNKSKAYDTIKPIITSSGVGSDTLTLMLKRGEEYPIPNGQIKVYMLVRAIRDEKNKIGDIINRHYGDSYFDNFYNNDYRFKNELGCLVNEISDGKYKDLADFFDQMGINIEKANGFQYKKVNQFIKTSVILKYNNRTELLEDLLAAENKDPQIKASIQKLASYSSNPNSFLQKVNKQNYVDVNYKLSKNIIDFINSIPAQYNSNQLNNAGDFLKLISANQSEIKLLNNANTPSDDSKKSSPNTTNVSSSDTNNFNIASNDLYAEAYKLKMLISAYNYAIFKICYPSPDFDLTEYVKNDKSDVCKCQNKLEKYQKIISLNNNIRTNADSNGPVFSLELQKDALDLIKKIFNEKNQKKSNMEDLLNVLKVNNLCEISQCKFESWDELKADPYYGRKYSNAIALVDKIYAEGLDEEKRESTTNQDLIDLVKNNNNVDLYFDKTIIQNEKNTFLRFEKEYIDRWCPPLISRVVILPIGALLWPINMQDNRIDYRPTSNGIITSKILEGSSFDKDNNTSDGYLKDDSLIFDDLIKQIESINVTPTITSPPTGT